MTTSTVSEKRKYPAAKTGVKNFTLIPETADKVCNLDYLVSVSRGNKKIIENITAVFFKETKKEMVMLTAAIEKNNFTLISTISHKIKSAFSILGISSLEAVFTEMEYLSSNTSAIGKIEQLNHRVNIVFNQARAEMKAPE
jgi:HPt (histidine-containing phosphotransfer) domain-containing protein